MFFQESDPTSSASIRLALAPHLPVAQIPEAASQILAYIRTTKARQVELTTLDRPGDSTIAVALALLRAAAQEDIQLSCHGPLEAAMGGLQTTTPAPTSLRRERILARLGRRTLEGLRTALDHAAFLGTVTMALLGLIRHPGQLRLKDTIGVMGRVGAEAVPIVGLIGFLLGLIMAFMSAVQLQQFGANIYVASLVALAMVRELGPIMTAILVAGRSGSAFAAEIGTMRVSEEVDALTTMGFDPVRFLVLPKLIASAVVVPFLTLYANIFAIAGGLMVGTVMLDLTPTAYMQQTLRTLTLFDVLWGFFKSALFAIIIALIGCHRGFAVRGGAESVGRATTSAVVTSIFFIILVDSILAVILRYWR